MRKSYYSYKQMKLRIQLILMFLSLFWAIPLLADDDVLITRDGSMIAVKIEKIGNSQVTFIDLKNRKRGRLNVPSNSVYMILKEKSNNIFFDEEGNQTTSAVVRFDKKDNIIFFNRGEMVVAYNISIGKKDVTFQLKDKKGAPFFQMDKSEIFMIRNSDGTTILYNDSYQERQIKQQVGQSEHNIPAPLPSSHSQPTQPSLDQSINNTTLSSQNQPGLNTSATSGQQLLASSNEDTGFYPTTGMNAKDIETAVNKKNPYTLYRKGSMAEYCFQYKGKQTQLMGLPTYFQQIVSDERIENGMLVAYIKGALLNKKHEPLKGIAASFKESIFPVEIDTAGTYHLTHNFIEDFNIITKRSGYGVLVPGDMRQGMRLKSGTLYDNTKNLVGVKTNIETVYSDWQVVGQENISTPAGTFDCVKITGYLKKRAGNKGTFYGQNITCWMARGIGIVQYETIAESDKNQEPFIVYLNKVFIK